MRARLLALMVALIGCGDPIVPVCGGPPIPPAPRGSAISVIPPPRDMASPDLASPDLAPAYPPAPACGCLLPSVLGLTPLSVPAGYQGFVQLFGVGGWAAGIQAGDLALTPGLAVTGISRRSSDNLLLWIEVPPQAQGAFDLRIRGSIALRDALMVP